MKVVLVPVGSAGDVHPFVGVGVALRERGHQVAVVTNPHFLPFVDRVGLRGLPLGTAEEYDAVTRHRHLWHPTRGLRVLSEMLRRYSLELYRMLEAECRGDDTVLVGATLAFPARVAHDTLGVPLVTMHLQPANFISVHDMPVLHPWLRRVDRWPRVLTRAMRSLLVLASDQILGPAANALAQNVGYPRVSRITTEWWHSPQRVIGLFPDWYAAPQPDWPTQTVLTGFPRYDDTAPAESVAETDRFLDDGPPPVVFVPGSANRHTRQFFASAVDANRRRGGRALLLTRYPEALPQPLPDGVKHVDYVPLARLLPRAAALVHHGGIGTAAQGLAAGIPQIVMPMAFDQHDNARRLERLGVGSTIRPSAFRGPRVAAAIDELAGSTEVGARCQARARQLTTDDPITRTCELIEAAGRRATTDA